MLQHDSEISAMLHLLTQTHTLLCAFVVVELSKVCVCCIEYMVTLKAGAGANKSDRMNNPLKNNALPRAIKHFQKLPKQLKYGVLRIICMYLPVVCN